MNVPFQKDDVRQACLLFVKERLSALQSELDELKNDLTSESKSSAGDNHETGRAMIQLEQECLGGQYSAVRKQFELLQRLGNQECKNIVLGSLAKINEQWYYFATGIGTVEVKGVSVIAVGLTSPPAQAVKGMALGSSTQFRDQLYRIEEIY
ncbi:MAG: hypothetical protein J4F31_02355 [Flavobacteriales bacterium]|nr:hypothetical protein [Flavobacteriales bacterium]